MSERDYVRDYLEGRANLGDDYDEAIARQPFDLFMHRRESAILRETLIKLFPDGVPRALDFACGTGRITQSLESLASECWGVDISSQQLEVAKARCCDTTFIQTDGSGSDLTIPTMDVVTAFRFFGNADDELRHSALRTITGNLRPGGYLILNNHRNPWTTNGVLLRVRGERTDGRLSYWHLKRLLTTHGFRVLNAYGIGAWLLLARWSRAGLLERRLAQRLEWFSRRRLLAPVSPGMVLVARKEIG